MAETRKIYMHPNFNKENTGLETVIAYLHNRAVTYAQYSLKTYSLKTYYNQIKNYWFTAVYVKLCYYSTLY